MRGPECKWRAGGSSVQVQSHRVAVSERHRGFCIPQAPQTCVLQRKHQFDKPIPSRKPSWKRSSKSSSSSLAPARRRVEIERRCGRKRIQRSLAPSAQWWSPQRSRLANPDGHDVAEGHPRGSEQGDVTESVIAVAATLEVRRYRKRVNFGCKRVGC